MMACGHVASFARSGARDRWEHIRRACEREAVRRAWGAFWRDAEAVALGRGDERGAEGYRRMARRAEKRAARIRRAVLQTGR